MLSQGHFQGPGPTRTAPGSAGQRETGSGVQNVPIPPSPCAISGLGFRAPPPVLVPGRGGCGTRLRLLMGEASTWADSSVGGVWVQ